MWVVSSFDCLKLAAVPPRIISRAVGSFRVTLVHTVKFKAGETIVSEGAEGKTAYLIVSGSVEVSVGQAPRPRFSVP
jgi:CRP-like cAMP-binding protein